MKFSGPPRLQTLPSIVTVILLFLVGEGILEVCRAAKSAPDDDGELTAWVSQRIAALQPKPEEKRLDEIGWSDDIRHALRLAKEHRRPVFLFTHDGRINLGRC